MGPQNKKERQRLKRGSSALEYTVFIIIFSLAIVLMQTYILRGFSGRWRAAADIFGYGSQFDPDVSGVTEANNASL